MPQPPTDEPRRHLLLTVTADTLVAADFTPRRRRPARTREGGRLTPYRRVLALLAARGPARRRRGAPSPSEL